MSEKLILDTVYPIGVVIAMGASWAGFAGQTWVQFAQGRTLVGLDSTDTAFDGVVPTNYIGEKEHTLTIDEMPSHNHDFGDKLRGSATHHYGWSGTRGMINGSVDEHHNTTYTTGGGQPHNNVPPYEVVYYYKRTA